MASTSSLYSLLGVEELLEEAKRHHDRGAYDLAERLCLSVLHRDPKNPSAMLLAGSIERRRGNLDLALSFYNRLADTKNLHATMQAGLICHELRDYPRAIEYFQRALDIQPDLTGAMMGTGRCLTSLRKADEALSWFARAKSINPDTNSLRYSLALALMALGRMPEAATQLRESIARGDRVAACYRELAHTQRFEEEPAELDAIRGLLERPGLPAQARALLHEAAGKILDDLGRHDEAFDHVQASKITSN